MQKLELSPVKPSHWSQCMHDPWRDACKPAECPFDDAGLASTWRLATLRQVERSVGIYLAFVRSRGDFDPEKPLGAYIDRQQVKEFLAAYAPGRAETTVATVVRGVAYYLRATQPPDGLPWLTKLAHRLTYSAKPSRPKLPRMASIAELVGLGLRLMETGLAKLAAGKVSGAQLYRDGLMIAMLVARPLRLRNLCALRIGHSLLPANGRYKVKFSGTETKKSVPIDFYYPDWLTRPLDLYLHEIRLLLVARSKKADTGWLWIGRRGNPLPTTNVTSNVTNATKRHLGRGVSPHLFRDCAATDIALLDPEHVRITKDVLGHATLASSQKFYNQAGSFRALADLERVLLGLMED